MVLFTSNNHMRFLRILLLAALLGWSGLLVAQPDSFLYQDCEARWDGQTLTVSNQFLERRWTLTNGLLTNQSLKDRATGQEKLLRPSDRPSPAPDFAVRESCQQTSVRLDTLRPVVVEATSLQVAVVSVYASYTLTTHVKLYPQTPAVTTWLAIAGQPPGQGPSNASAPVLTGGNELATRDAPAQTDLCELFTLNNVHQQLNSVTLYDQTDWRDNLVHTDTYLLTNPSYSAFSSNLLLLDDQQTHDGLIFLKEAPLPYARPVKQPYDLQVDNNRFAFTGLGAGTDSARQSYPFTVLLYKAGTANATRVLHQYQRQFRQYDPQRDELIWHAIWGDRNRDGRMSESFMAREMALNKEMGINHLYFSDGWQKGPSTNSVNAHKGGLWENQWSRPDYWEPNPNRFPTGFDNLTRQAVANGFKIGMWYNPDRTNDYANWKRDTDVLLTFYRRFGATFFKYDGVQFTTKLGERNILKAMHRIVQETNGKAAIEIDITAGLRTGYFQGMSYGTLFLENRYTDFRKYYPHLTLRNLWQLSHYVDPRRLRIEFLNNERNRHLYPNDPLAPATYPADYLFAVTMFAKPLAWFETSGLSAAYRATVKPLIAVYRQHWEAIHQGLIVPIGQQPDGFSWTGFHSEGKGGAGYVVVFRERTSAGQHDFRLNLPPGTYRFEALAGAGRSFRVRIGADGQVCMTLPAEQQYGFYRYKLVARI